MITKGIVGSLILVKELSSNWLLFVYHVDPTIIEEVLSVFTFEKLVDAQFNTDYIIIY